MTEEKKTVHDEVHTTKKHNEEAPTLWDGVYELGIYAVLSGAAFYAYFDGYVLALKNLSLGKYSFLVVGVLFGLIFVYDLSHFISDRIKK